MSCGYEKAADIVNFSLDTLISLQGIGEKSATKAISKIDECRCKKEFSYAVADVIKDLIEDINLSEMKVYLEDMLFAINLILINEDVSTEDKLIKKIIYDNRIKEIIEKVILNNIEPYKSININSIAVLMPKFINKESFLRDIFNGLVEKIK